jgi:peroxiredoxin
VNIVGVSFDPPQINATFAAKNNFQYPLWTDSKKELALHYGAAFGPTALFASRVTVVIDAAGQWLLTYFPSGDLSKHPEKVLEDCEKIFGGEEQ